MQLVCCICTHATWHRRHAVCIPFHYTQYFFSVLTLPVILLCIVCFCSLPNGHINIMAFDRMAAIVGAFTKHMHAVKSPNEAPPGEYKTFCQHMQRSSKLSETGKSVKALILYFYIAVSVYIYIYICIFQLWYLKMQWLH